MDVGLIGLGAMGRGMGSSLRKKGHKVRVFDVRAEAMREFARDGGIVCDNPAQVARDSEVVVSVVVNAAQTEEVLFGENGAAKAMRKEAVFVMCSTVDPQWSAALEARLEALGLFYVDAPLSAVDIFVKDLGIVLDTARASKFPLPLASTAHQMFMQASSSGHGKEDDAAVIKIFPGIVIPGSSGGSNGPGSKA